MRLDLIDNNSSMDDVLEALDEAGVPSTGFSDYLDIQFFAPPCNFPLLQKRYLQYYRAQTNFDLSIVCQDNEIVQCHKFIVGLYSRTLRERTRVASVIHFPEFIASDMTLLLRFMYAHRTLVPRMRIGNLIKMASVLEMPVFPVNQRFMKAILKSYPSGQNDCDSQHEKYPIKVICSPTPKSNM